MSLSMNAIDDLINDSFNKEEKKLIMILNMNY